MKKYYYLFLDDLRDLNYLSKTIYPFVEKDWIVCRNSSEALGCIINNGIPAMISFDHDLGGEDTAMVFLKNWVSVFQTLLFRNITFTVVILLGERISNLSLTVSIVR